VSHRGVPERRNKVFHTVRRWPLVSTDDLVKLLQSLLQAQRLGGPPATGDLLILVEYELRRRAHPSHWEYTSGISPGSN
jgi:hypothetical protein